MVEALSVSVTRIRLVTFGVSGALAGLAGGLYVLAYRGVPFGGFAPVLGLEAFAMVVVGGMGSLWGAVLGALVHLYVSVLPRRGRATGDRRRRNHHGAAVRTGRAGTTEPQVARLPLSRGSCGGTV